MYVMFTQTGGDQIAVNSEQVRYIRLIDGNTTAIVFSARGNEDEWAISVDDPILEVVRALDPATFSRLPPTA